MNPNLRIDSPRVQDLAGGLGRFLLAVLLVTVSGCQLIAPGSKSGKKLQEAPNIAVTYDQARLRMRALVNPMCGQVEQTADTIIAGTTNPVVQRAALRWKIEAVPSLRQSLFLPDPLNAVFDTWALCFQMIDYFETGDGKAPLGEASARAAATCRRLEDDFAQVAAAGSKTGDISKIRAVVRKWAADHPVHYSIAARESALSRVFEREMADSFSYAGAVNELTTSVDDLNRRLEVYSDQLFRQARWEAQLFQSELLAELSSGESIPFAAKLVKSTGQVADFMNRVEPPLDRALIALEDLPKVIDSGREAAVNALHDEFAQTFQVVKEERVAALAQLTAERVAALKDFRDELAVERRAIARDLEQISQGAVDHAMWRLAQIAAALMAVMFLAAVALLFGVRRMFFQYVAK